MTFCADIHPENQVIGATRPEKIAIGSLFALTAATLCGTLIYRPETALFVAELFGAAALFTSAYTFLMYRMQNLKEPQLSPELSEKKKKLENLTAEMCRKAGLQEIPKIVITKSKTEIAGTLETRKGPILLISEDALEKNPLEDFGAILGHEIAHIKMKHFKTRTAFFLFTLSSGLSAFMAFAQKDMDNPLVWAFLVQSLLTNTYLSKQQEFQADRIGAVLSEAPSSLAKTLHNFYNKQGTSPSAPRWARLYMIAGRCLLAGPEMAVNLLCLSHPHSLRRIDRLRHLSAPPSIARSLKRDLKLLPKTLIRTPF